MLLPSAWFALDCQTLQPVQSLGYSLLLFVLRNCPFFLCVSSLKGVIWFLNKGFFVNINNSRNEEPHRSEDASAEKVRKEYNLKEIILLTDEESHGAGQTFL